MSSSEEWESEEEATASEADEDYVGEKEAEGEGDGEDEEEVHSEQEVDFRSHATLLRVQQYTVSRFETKAYNYNRVLYVDS